MSKNLTPDADLSKYEDGVAVTFGPKPVFTQAMIDAGAEAIMRIDPDTTGGITQTMAEILAEAVLIAASKASVVPDAIDLDDTARIIADGFGAIVARAPSAS